MNTKEKPAEYRFNGCNTCVNKHKQIECDCCNAPIGANGRIICEPSRYIEKEVE